MPMLHGLLIDDHRLFASGLKLLLLDEFDFDTLDICYEPISAEEIIANREGIVDLIVVDFYVPGFNASDMIEKLRACAPVAKLICISASSSPDDERCARHAGADLYLPKHTDPEILVAAVKTLLSGKPALSRLLDAKVHPALGLTPRQTQIIQEMARGLSNKEIALNFELSPETIKSHVAEMYRQTGVSNRIALINWARTQGLLAPC